MNAFVATSGQNQIIINNTNINKRGGANPKINLRQTLRKMFSLRVLNIFAIFLSLLSLKIIPHHRSQFSTLKSTNIWEWNFKKKNC